jgi:hypothetical protein
VSRDESGLRTTRATRLRTLLVVAAFGILLAYVLLVEARRAPPTDPEATPTPWPILGWEMDDLRSVHVSDGSRVTRLDRVGTSWRVVEPREDVADPRAIHLPLLELAGLEARLLVSAEIQDSATYGLDVPALTITVETRSGERERLYAGRVTPDGTAFYVQREGDPGLYIVDQYKIELLQEWLSAPPYRATPTPSG